MDIVTGGAKRICLSFITVGTINILTQDNLDEERVCFNL